MTGNVMKWLEMAQNNCKWMELEMTESCKKWIDISEDGWKLLKPPGSVCKCSEIAVNGCK